MKTFIFLLTILVMSSNLCMADVWVVYDKNGSVYSLSEQNDAVIPKANSVKVLKGNIESIGLTRPIDEYSFNGSKFIPNTAKIKEKEDKQIAIQKVINDKKSIKESALSKLKTSAGLTDAEINAILGE